MKLKFAVLENLKGWDSATQTIQHPISFQESLKQLATDLRIANIDAQRQQPHVFYSTSVMEIWTQDETGNEIGYALDLECDIQNGQEDFYWSCVSIDDGGFISWSSSNANIGQWEQLMEEFKWSLTSILSQLEQDLKGVA